jgi:hypothetical protein
MRPQTHEHYSCDETATPGSNRSFGIVIALALLLVSLMNYRQNGNWWAWTGGLAALFLAAASLYPPILNPLNWIWFKFGLLLHQVVNPVVMGILFYVTVMPIGLIRRAMGKDALRLKRKPEDNSYWIARMPRGPAPETMKDQF